MSSGVQLVAEKKSAILGTNASDTLLIFKATSF